MIDHVRRTLEEAQGNYVNTKKEFLETIFALEKYRSYLINSKMIVLIDQATLKHLLKKSNYKSRFIRWVLFLQEFNFEIHDKANLENVVADHLSHLGPKTTPIKELSIDDLFPNDQLLKISHQVTPWHVDLVNFKVCGVLPLGLSC